MTLEDYETFAEALDAASAVFRRKGAALRAMQASGTGDQPDQNPDPLQSLSPDLGRRQVQIMQFLAASGTAGASTGQIAAAVAYDQPNVYLTLQSLMRRKMVEKDETKNPHIYRVADHWLPSTGND